MRKYARKSCLYEEICEEIFCGYQEVMCGFDDRRSHMWIFRDRADMWIWRGCMRIYMELTTCMYEEWMYANMRNVCMRMYAEVLAYPHTSAYIHSSYPHTYIPHIHIHTFLISAYIHSSYPHTYIPHIRIHTLLISAYIHSSCIHVVYADIQGFDMCV